MSKVQRLSQIARAIAAVIGRRLDGYVEARAHSLCPSLCPVRSRPRSNYRRTGNHQNTQRGSVGWPEVLHSHTKGAL